MERTFLGPAECEGSSCVQTMSPVTSGQTDDEAGPFFDLAPDAERAKHGARLLDAPEAGGFKEAVRHSGSGRQPAGNWIFKYGEALKAAENI